MKATLTIAELARASGKTENNIRQNIFRKLLKSTKRGNVVEISRKEAERWAKKKKITLQFSPEESEKIDLLNERSVRIHVLAGLAPNSRWINIVTAVKQRRLAELATSSWEVLAETDDKGLQLLKWDCKESEANSWIEKAAAGAAETILGTEIHFNVGSSAKHYFCPRIHDDDKAPAPQVSPFANASATAVEFMAGDDLPTAVSQKLNEIPADWFKKIGLSIAEYFDHAGSLIVYTATDDVRGQVSVMSKKALKFSVRTSANIILKDYFVTLLAWRRDELVFDRAFDLTQPSHHLSGNADIDRWKYQIFHKPSGRLVDEDEATLILSIQGTIQALGPSVELRDANNKPFGHVQTTALTSQFGVGENSDRAASLYHHRLSQQRYEKSKSRGELFRLDSEEAALEQIAKILKSFSAADGPIYWADPYFFSSPKDGKFVSNWTTSLRKHFLKVVQAAQGLNLRIICGHDTTVGDDPFDLIGYGSLMNTVEVCCVRKKNSRGDFENAFHDRWITNKSREYLLTHSLNGIQGDGLTIVKLPFHVYFADSEYLWSIPASDQDFRKTQHRGGRP